MYSDKQSTGLMRVLLILAVFLVIAAVAIILPDDGMNEESAQAIRYAVEQSARQCYVVEGVYPPNTEYLEENYGLQVNRRNYYITYNAFASNMPPAVKVTLKNKQK